jgi:thiamine biosynthesis lipoprotein
MESTRTPDRQNRPAPIGRRRLLGIAGCAAGLAAGGGGLAALLSANAALASPGYRWRGVVLGAAATITLVHRDRRTAKRIVDDSLLEIRRLERIFSLYRSDSALSALNRAGALSEPPADMLRLLSLARRVYEASGGVFDPTVQPLWRLYADHFAGPAAEPSGPGRKAIAATLKRVGFGRVDLGPARIALPAGAALTLNGIAQGYIADRVAARMRAAGVRDTLIDLGEIRALGRHASGRPWRAGIAMPGARERMLATVELTNMALATSGDDGTCFDTAGRLGHILDPRTGRPARHNRSVSVRAPTAALADALSTAMFAMPAEDGFKMVRTFPGADALVLRRDGRLLGWR